MIALILTLCFSNGHCYATAPELFLTMEECNSELLHLTETLQVNYNNIQCKHEKDV